MMKNKQYSSFDEYLIDTSRKYKIPLSAMEIGFLSSLLSRYAEDEENKNRGLEIANIINGKMNTVITEIRKSGR